MRVNMTYHTILAVEFSSSKSKQTVIPEKADCPYLCGRVIPERANCPYLSGRGIPDEVNCTYLSGGVILQKAPCAYLSSGVVLEESGDPCPHAVLHSANSASAAVNRCRRG